jgi:hypothetical protein
MSLLFTPSHDRIPFNNETWFHLFSSDVSSGGLTSISVSYSRNNSLSDFSSVFFLFRPKFSEVQYVSFRFLCFKFCSMLPPFSRQWLKKSTPIFLFQNTNDTLVYRLEQCYNIWWQKKHFHSPHSSVHFQLDMKEYYQ